MNAAALAPALAQWRSLLGDAQVQTDAATLDSFASSTASWPARPAAVVRPGCREDVVGVVRIASTHGVPLYPVSTGRNWGYGDACAVLPGQVIVDMSGMRGILEADGELGYVVIEPGVTQGQLSRFLAEQHLPLWMDCTGAGPDTSLLGNILERGFGHSPYGNRVQQVCGMEVVLADGEVVRTGYTHFQPARAARVFPYGVGPWLDGLFTQSALGIVTSVGLWLMPQTPVLGHFLCSVPSHDGVDAVVDALRPLRMDGTLRSVIHIGNDLRVLSGGMTYPREAAQGQRPLPEALRASLCHDAGIAAWTVSGALYGNAQQVQAARRALRRALARLPLSLRFIDEQRLALAGRAARLFWRTGTGRKLAARVALGRSLFNMNRGIPDGRFLAGAYWRRRGGLPPGFPANADPARDNCGLLWLSPVMPSRGADLRAVMNLAQPYYARYGFDLFATFSMITERALGGVLTIAYDKDDPAESADAQTCYHSLFDALMAAGYLPYRVGLQSMAALDPQADSFWRTASRIKAALDPLNIIAPGRYQPPPGAGGTGS
ncbi:FAD-binding oxidoreductase [Pseudoduganella ginsengisoli]|uniref:D-lactate dehydrogenase (cytochrome) n=1 Tax=Pseudoduganella ginsengisoli TaxID=1462440 RepID=A0A6L6Q3Q1_9BURK|nr:FAD-binding oxidoreductase [Pseudoduganella ginsengisoli]MTW04225.1 FAD-binding protein [Pseudoduganella ginsengisoli]